MRYKRTSYLILKFGIVAFHDHKSQKKIGLFSKFQRTFKSSESETSVFEYSHRSLTGTNADPKKLYQSGNLYQLRNIPILLLTKLHRRFELVYFVVKYELTFFVKKLVIEVCFVF